MDQIIAEVGATKATFYNHFESKDDLIIAVLEERDRVETESLDEGKTARGDGRPRGEILALFDVLHDWMQDESLRRCIFMSAAAAFPPPTDPVHQAAAEHSANIASLIRRRAAPAGATAPEVVARHIMLLLAGTLVSRQVTGDVNAAATARHAAAALLDRRLPSVEAVA